MSAATENLLLKIFEVENQINEAKSRGENVSSLEKALLTLKTQFATLNEALNKPQGLLKG